MASLLPIGCANETPTVIPALCGSTQCTDDQTCQNNTCVPKDAPDPNVCDPACKDGQSCQNNTCVPKAPDPNVCDPACKDGQSCQNGTCKDPEHDPSPKVCDPACDETQYCQNDECKDIACPDGEALCKGGCFDLKTDINNCGECGNACGAKTCYNGECRFICDTGLATCENGCADLKTDDKNCGACGHACTDGATCQKGFCTIPLNKCVEGYVTTTVNDKPIKAYCVRSELELEAIRNNINAGGKYPADNTDNAYILMKDLDLGTRAWVPIGTAAHPFIGTFLGNGKSISGNITTQGTNVGLFGIVSGAYFNHLNLHINLTAKGNHIQNKGPLAGFVYHTTLINIHEEGTIQDPDDFITNGAYPNSAYDDMGGLIGLLINSNISNSSIKCHINFYGGGRVGGLAGMIAGSTISNCTSFIKTTAPSSKTIPQSRSSMPLAKTGPK